MPAGAQMMEQPTTGTTAIRIIRSPQISAPSMSVIKKTIPPSTPWMPPMIRVTFSVERAVTMKRS